MDNSGPLLLTVAEAARRLSLGRSKLYDLLLRGEIVSFKIGSCRRVPLAALTDFIDRKRAEGVDR